MASQTCWKCLARPSTSPLCLGRNSSSPILLPPTSKAFSTTTASWKAAAPKKVMERGPSFTLKKKAFQRAKPPAPGERKAMRKRVVLSNANALEVPDMVDLTADNLADEATEGIVMGLQNNTVDSLRAAEAFKSNQSWGMFRRPGILVRAEGVEIAKLLDDAEQNKEAARIVVDGVRECGKSLLIIHALAMGFLKNWVVINLPDAQAFTSASTAYAPIEGTNPRLYFQPDYIASLLSQIAESNHTLLDTLQITQQHNLPIPIQSNISLLRLCQLGAQDPDVAWPIYLAFWAEITSEGRPPVLFALDGLNHIMMNSLYRSVEFELIHAQELALIKQFTDYLSGKHKLPNGGAIIAATTRSHAPNSKSMDLMINQQLGRQIGLSEKDIPLRDPWERKYDLKGEGALEGVKVVMLRGVTKDEARGLMEYWARSGVYRGAVDEKSVVEKWVVGGHGVVGEVERVGLEMRVL